MIKTQKVKTVVMWSFLAANGLLIILSIAAAFMGASQAQEFFATPALAAFWISFTTLTIIGLAVFKQLINKPEMLLMHAGIVLILLGAMLGSDGAHQMRSQWLGSEKIPAGFIALFEGDINNRPTDNDMTTELGSLPFSIRLNDFSVEHYRPADPRWHLWVELEDFSHGHSHESEPVLLDWQPGREIVIPGTEAVLQISEYIDNARAVYEDPPHVHIISQSQQAFSLPAVPGRQIQLDQPEVSLTVKKVFSNLRVIGHGSDRQVIDEPGPQTNPAVQVQLEWPDGQVHRQYVLAGSPHSDMVGGIRMHYVSPGPSSAQPDAQSDRPAMEIQVLYGQYSCQTWLIPGPNQTYAGAAIELPGPTDGPEQARYLSFYLTEPQGPIQAYKSDVSIIENGREVLRQTIQVNHPLYYRGYHFYQHSYDSAGHQYTILHVKSADGLMTVYAGFFLLCLGSVWWAIGKPAVKYFKKTKPPKVPQQEQLCYGS